MKHDLLLFLGRFHPLLVHLPIGGLVLLGLLEFLAAITRWKDAAQNSRGVLAFVSATAAASAAAGWMLAQTGGYDEVLLSSHRALGSALAAGCLLTLLLRQWGGPWAYRASLAATLLLLVVVSHLGGSMTHGRDFLTHDAPAVFRARGGLRPQNARTVAACSSTQRPVFEGVIEPMVRQHRCCTCHGAEKQKAELRLDTIEGWLRGGQDGPLIKPGRADDSLLIQRLRLPVDADGHMPPEDQPQLSLEEIALLEWWINAGAPAAATVGDLEPKAEIRRILDLLSAQPPPRN